MVTGSNVTFTCTPSGGLAPLTYQWRRAGVNVGGATSATYIRSMSVSDSGVAFDCVVTDASAQTVDTNDVSATVASVLTASVSRSPSVALYGNNITFSSSVSGGLAPINYQWRRNGVNIGGATSSTYVRASQAIDSGAAFDCIITDALGQSVDTNNVSYTPAQPASYADSSFTQSAGTTVNHNGLVNCVGNDESLTTTGWNVAFEQGGTNIDTMFVGGFIRVTIAPGTPAGRQCAANIQAVGSLGSFSIVTATVTVV